MTQPSFTPEQLASIQQALAQEPKLREALAGLPVTVQLDALLATYVHLATEHGELEKVGAALLNLGGQIMFRHMLQQAPARCSVPASLEADHHVAPSTVH